MDWITMFERAQTLVIAIGVVAGALFPAVRAQPVERRPADARSPARFSSSYPGGAASQSSWSGVFTEAQAAEGAALYESACASCHGVGLGGGEAVPALVGVTFSATWEGVSLFDLFERIRTTMPPGKSGTVTRPGYASIVAYLLKSNGMPAGEKALGADKASLAGLVYQTYRP
jgi:mono/diheme cytochrome c family protein